MTYDTAFFVLTFLVENIWFYIKVTDFGIFFEFQKLPILGEQWQGSRSGLN